MTDTQDKDRNYSNRELLAMAKTVNEGTPVTTSKSRPMTDADFDWLCNNGHKGSQ